jgi:hypothetical protein
MAVGLPLKTTYANGDVYSASDVNDTNGTINTTAAPYAAGKNKIINGDFGVWQRGTSFSNPANGSFQADRFSWGTLGTGVTATISQQTFTPGTAPVAGYEGRFFFRYNQTNTGAGNVLNLLVQKVENVQTLAGQTATLSFWGKADASRTLSVDLEQDFGSGGSSAVASTSASLSFTTSWTRFTYTVTLASISGKTIGTSSNLKMRLFLPAGVASTIDIWGVQLENGSTATPFQTATGTIQGELAACQRYYQRYATFAYARSGFMMGAFSSTLLYATKSLPVTMRALSSIDYSTLALNDGPNIFAVTAVVINTADTNAPNVYFSVASGLTQFRPYEVINNNSATGFIALVGEL